MKILLLGPARPALEAFLGATGDQVMRREDKLTAEAPPDPDTGWLISYGYRHILPGELLERFPRRAVNLHISYLPWNRGADPNLWSFLENTPKGVTVHYLDPGLDTGDLIAQREVAFEATDTLGTSYARLSREMVDLFQEVWPELKAGRMAGTPQPAGGSFHRARDRANIAHLLTRLWDTPVAELMGRAPGERP